MNKAAAICVLISLFSSEQAAGQSLLRADVDQLKVAFVYNFSKYFTWPPGAKWNDSPHFNICIDSVDVASGHFPSLGGQVTQDKTIRILDLSQGGTDIAEECHIWYIAGEDYPARQALIQETGGTDVLTVSDRENFSNLGGVLELVIVQNKIKFRVNTEAAARKRLGASSFLLRLALPAGQG